MSLTLYAPNQAQAENAARKAFETFARLEQIMSDYRPTSDIRRFAEKAGQGWQPIAPELVEVLSFAQGISSKSDGAFDVTCSPLVELWREARRTQAMPDAWRLAQARRLTGWQMLQVDPLLRTARLEKPGMKVDLGGIAKGYACWQAALAASAAGSRSVLVEAGGDMHALEGPPGGKGWQVETPVGTMSLWQAGLSTSGDANQFVEIGGVRYSHILDPRTGLGMTSRRQVTVKGWNGMITDALATAVCLLGPGRGDRLARSYGADVFWSESKN